MLRKTIIPSLIITAFLSSMTEVKAQLLPMTIDNFSDVSDIRYQQVENNSPTGTIVQDTDVNLDPNNVIGGSRSLILENLANSEPGFLRSNFVVDSDIGLLLWSNDVMVQSKAIVLWNAAGDGLNVALAGNETLSIGIRSIDHNAVMTWTFLDDMARQGIATVTNLFPGETVSLSFDDPDDFTFDADFNFSEVEQISLMLDSAGVNATDASLEFATLTPGTNVAVPEPRTTLGVFALGGLGLLARRRQKKKN